MPRTGRRVTIAKGIYQDSFGYEVRVVVGGHTYSSRMPKDSTGEELRARHAQLMALGLTDTPKAERGTLRSDARRYLNLVKHLRSWKERRAHLDAWIALYGDVYRHRLSREQILTARVKWLKVSAPKTINHRVSTLRHLYRTLDGTQAKTPCDDVTPLEVPKTPIQRIPDDLILTVDQNLQKMEGRTAGRPMSGKTRARFRVFVSTGKRPVEIMRAEPQDVNLEARVWVPRDAKGGYCPGVYLNDDMLEAWKLFIQEKAWGPYSTGNFARTIRAAGWPEGVRPYQARHSMWITASEMGVDLADISTGAGHKDIRMTRKAYVPVLNSRLQKMSEAMGGRFKGWPVAEKSGPDDK